MIDNHVGTHNMSINQHLQNSLQSILAHHPWYGPATYDILSAVSFEAAYEKPPGSVHSIAGVLLHMLGWTLEVTERMGGKPAGEPAGGDWPDPGQPDEHSWQTLVSDFKLANATLQGIIQNFAPDKWQQHTHDDRPDAQGIGVTYQALIEGLIQHHVYHSGQIALLKRLNGIV